MPRKPDEFNVHILLDGGHREEIRVKGPKEVTKLMNDIFMGSPGEDFIRLPKELENEFLIVRPSRVSGVAVEALFNSSI
ncbi:hypothetical protein [Synechococcus sp. PCC 7336]|uniref:hypothetical protein n=1 Tax=Synechococcus sp. PCC 7336 TaxID=195250 RepID=UPI0003461B86|nr:hypothetical protein [Synechococcus sp. PCC 7336]